MGWFCWYRRGVKISIYGLFNGEHCCYIGRTMHPWNRVKSQRVQHPGLRFEVLAMCDWNDRALVEGQMIGEARSRGECEMNTYPGPQAARRGPRASEAARRAQAARKLNLIIGNRARLRLIASGDA